MRMALALLMALAALNSPSAWSQNRCADPAGGRIEGTVFDPAGAIIPGAAVQSSGGESATTDANGHYVLCVPAGAIDVSVQVQGFDVKTVKVMTRAGQLVRADLQLAIARVTTDVQVTDEGGTGNGRSEEITLGTKGVQRLADDPDDFIRQLQVLASQAGGDPTSAIFLVDGFQNTSALPPKSAIAAIRISPDLFSAQYQWAPFSGGVIEIVTKPGADKLHGAVFFTDSDAIFNATDPLSVTATPAGKHRYGFELSGPIVAKKSGFALALEKRDINEFNVVDAVALDANENLETLQQTVAAPQRLWIGSVRGDLQATAKDVATLSFSSNVNNLGNQGIGGLTLPEAGYSSLVSEYDLRFSNTLTPNANVLHETRVGYTWKPTAQTPLATTPSLQVTGYFLGGGATAQNLNNREQDLEIDDDAVITRGKQTWKFGGQSLAIFVRDYDPNTFNGAYVFGGGGAPVLDANNNPTGQTTTISGLEQYRRALLNLPGGTPTTYQLTSGIALVPLSQWRLGLFVQDAIKVAPGLTVDAGLRYQLQTTPGSFKNFEPRLGLAWSPGKKQTWVFHLRAGIFNNTNNASGYGIDVNRLNGIRQHETTVYSPNFNNPLTLTPNSIAVSTLEQFPRSLTEQGTVGIYFNVERDIVQHWRARVNFYYGQDWKIVRLPNINAPMVADSVGVAPDPTAALLAPRPIAPNENVFQYENSGHLNGSVQSFNLEQHSYKRLDLFFRYGHYNFKSDVGFPDISPQSSYSNAGESGHVYWLAHSRFTLEANVTAPYKLEFSTEFAAGNGLPYNITTGTDNNGDGVFNDRPSFAAAPGPGVYSTPFGLMTTNTVNGDVPRNLGTLPWQVHLDMNVSRSFKLNPRAKENARTITFNARSANMLNHTNVTAVNTILSSSAVGVPIEADTARRVELGMRVSF